MIRALIGTCLALLVLGSAAGCGGDDGSAGNARAPQKQASRPQTATTEAPATETATAPTDRTQTSTSPEQQPGGAGDEEPARSQALLTGRHGRVTPAIVRVPAYIAIRVELRTADGASYALRFGNRALRVGPDLGSVSADFPGLRPGKVLAGVPVGGGNPVRVEASAEPGP